MRRPRHARSRRRAGARYGPLLVLLACTMAITAAAAVDYRADPTAVEPAGSVVVSRPTSGWWYCPVTAEAAQDDEEGEEAVLAVTAATAEATTITLVRYTAEGRVFEEPVALEPGGTHLRTLTVAEAADPVAVHWKDGPAVATWSVEGDDSAAAPCEPGPSPLWHLTGFDTTAQNRALLHLFNPFGVDAVVRVTFGTPTGREALVLTDNVLVPAGDVLTMVLNDYEPEQPDLAATVETLAGRVVAGGELRLRPTANQPGPTGRALLRASPSAAASWSLAAVASREGTTSYASVYNPADREAAVEIRVSDPLPDGAALLSEVSVPAGGVIRVELDDTSGTPDYGVLVEAVTDLPVVVTGVSVVRTDAGDGVAASLAAAPASRWALAGATTAGYDTSLALYNPGADAVRVAVDAGEGTPRDWSAVELGPNERVVLDLTEVGGQPGTVPLRASGGGPFVAGLRSRSTGEPVRLWTATAVPALTWEGAPARPASWRDPRLSTSPVVPVDGGGAVGP